MCKDFVTILFKPKQLLRMGVNCKIRFENAPDNIVYGGQQVAGIVDITVPKPIKVRKLVLYIEGKGECEWRESYQEKDSDGNSHTKYKYYRGRDQYMNTETNLLSYETNIQPGRHTYDFMFQVPSGTPSSVQEKNGKIYYKMRVVFDRPWKTDFEFNSDFVVIQQIDLNCDPEIKIPQQQEEIKHYCCWCCKSKPVILTASIPQTGYVVGQKIPIKVIINNPSSVNIDHAEITLVKHIKYSSDSPSSHLHEEKELQWMSHGSSFSRNKKEYIVEMEVPYTVPTISSHLVNVINIYYKLNVKAKTPGCHISPSVSFSIIIGTIAIGQENNAPYNNEFSNAVMSPPKAPIQEFSNIMMPPSAPFNQQFSNVMMPLSAPMNQEFSNVMMPPSAPMNQQFSNVMVPPSAPTSNNFPIIMPPLAPLHNDFPNSVMPPPPAPLINDFSNMIPPVVAPSAPHASVDQNKVTKMLSTESSASHNNTTTIGFCVPSNNINKF